jgi:hypothetical protein
MKVAEVINGVVTHFPPYWKNTGEIPAGTAPLYFDAPDNTEEGWRYDYGTRAFSPAPAKEPEPTELPELTNGDVIRAVMDLTAALDVVIAQSYGQIDETPPSRYEFWRDAYLNNRADASVLERLVAGGVLTEEEAGRITAR